MNPQLPIHKAIELSNVELKGGTTLPLVVRADDNKLYVLKIFGIKHTRQRCYTTSEVLANYYAKKFDLQMPETVFIILDNAYIDFLREKDQKKYKNIEAKDYSKPCFASLYKSSLNIYSPSLEQKHSELYDLATIYAFDLLILNEDRRLNKPNILKDENGFWLIDHDKAFEGITYAANLYNKGTLPPWYSNHIFYSILKSNYNDNLFDTFEEYFIHINFNNLNLLESQFKSLGYDTYPMVQYSQYINEMKRNIPNFVKLVKKTLA
jgi:hypothetical protein